MMDNPEQLKLSRYSILIVDDNPHNLQVLGKLLRENDYSIEFATNGEAALVWLKKTTFDLILLDINMPGLSGFEVCSKIRSDSSLEKIPVIFLSAETDRESILKGFDLGAQDYITKPFDSRELLSRVKTHLTLKDSLEKLGKQNIILETTVLERTKQLRQANEQLLELDKAKSEFLRLVSHEIRTPLNGIIGPLELLKESGSFTGVEELMEILDLSVKRLEKFSLNALLITRLKTKQFEIRKEFVELPILFRDLLSENSEKISAHNLHVDIINKTESPHINGEPELIKTCFENILINSISYTPINSNLEILISDNMEGIVCEFKDNGLGFGEDALGKVFDLFSMGDASRDNSPGIGLSICKMIMEAHLGNIKIGNNESGGAFVVLQFNKTFHNS
jgi:two-component system sensor histidine kinase/response regulator